MARRSVITVLLIGLAAFACAPAAFAQQGMMQLLKSEWELSRKQMVQIAGRMPAEQFQFMPPHETRTFGGVVGHLAGENITWMESVAGMAHPGTGDRYEKLKTREELLKALSDM